MRKILITNDDGIMAEGIIRLVCCAKEFGEIWVVAPDSERSACSHAITLKAPIEVHPHDFPVDGVHAFSCSGTPADCVRVGSLNVMPQKPDLVLSGINLGYNVATDIQYSGTCGAAFEASFQGISAIAVSEGSASHHEVIDRYLKEILSEAIDYETVPGQIININFPTCSLSKYRGIKRDCTVSKGMIFKDHYEEEEKLADGGIRYMVKGGTGDISEAGSDLNAVLDGYIAIGRVNNYN